MLTFQIIVVKNYEIHENFQISVVTEIFLELFYMKLFEILTEIEYILTKFTKKIEKRDFL